MIGTLFANAKKRDKRTPGSMFRLEGGYWVKVDEDDRVRMAGHGWT